MSLTDPVCPGPDAAQPLEGILSAAAGTAEERRSLKERETASRTAVPASREHLEAVWRERAKRLCKRVSAAEARQDTLPVVVLGVGTELYGVHLQDVTEVFPPLRPTPVPGASASFSGVINVHGEIRPVIDLRQVLGMETVRTGEAARVILLRKDGREMGLQIDKVEQIRWIGTGDLASGELVRGAKEMGTAGSAAPPQHFSIHITGSTKDRLLLLGTDALFAELDTSQLNAPSKNNRVRLNQ